MVAAEIVDSIITLLSILGGAGGLFATMRAFLDYREGVSSRESDTDERFYKRLEERLEKTEQKLELVEAQLSAEKNYTSLLVLSLVQKGFEVPERG